MKLYQSKMRNKTKIALEIQKQNWLTQTFCHDNFSDPTPKTIRNKMNNNKIEIRKLRKKRMSAWKNCLSFACVWTIHSLFSKPYQFCIQDGGIDAKIVLLPFVSKSLPPENIGQKERRRRWIWNVGGKVIKTNFESRWCVIKKSK